MRIKVFNLASPVFSENHSHLENRGAKFIIPTLPAYSIGHFEANHASVGYSKYAIVGNALVFNYYKRPFMHEYGRVEGKLTIYYHGITDYQLFFPYIHAESFRRRQGEFLEDAHKSFENGAWMSFALMTAAVIEGVFYWYFEKNAKFQELIDLALAEELINQSDSVLIHLLREDRNKVHPTKHDEPFVTRSDAMNAMYILDKLLDMDWASIKIKNNPHPSPLP